ncbi:hypothetical protein DL766_000869 [Monosporascus sp. MC13-8B]|uniref:Uncharacterized protein n=1 Tax=Monosporascus cannonballus TaxID=155416 RepID=A0ABY0GUF7_9PEZI|nr:hypothetical protein DL762_010198 [Monosporascus cannonballus]RYO94095.1 hypothetical protein DL763_004163 [Monosporascus cannonballus]RYP38659.1 hypothetical protein DL766_000869 [Monosporascus sp. MC13-8B]
MGLRDLLKKKDRLDGGVGTDAETLGRLTAGPEFTFIRSDTHTQEIIQPPGRACGGGGGGDDDDDDEQRLRAKDSGASKGRRSLDVFRPSRSRDSSVSSAKSGGNNSSSLSTPSQKEGHRRLSQRLHLTRDKTPTSDYVPGDLPQISVTAEGAHDNEREWEKRATMLVQANEQLRSRSRSPSARPSPSEELAGLDLDSIPSRRPNGVVSSKSIDEDIQEAIRLHEEGDLDQSTRLFGQLADPQGANNPLSQVLYGLALRHGWGCEPDPARAVSYLSAAASNAAEVERIALHAGLQKGGAAKGELVLAIFELANCFRNGWGIVRDPVAAKQVSSCHAPLCSSATWLDGALEANKDPALD